jgi:GNAT superfamily N-acetyltransferase
MADLQHGWDGEPSRIALVRDDQGLACGVLRVHLPTRDNTHLASVDLTVDPLRRRKGLGRRIFSEGLELARSQGRQVAMAECYDRPEFMEFCRAMGLAKASEDVCRRQLVAEIDRTRLQHLSAEAGEHAHDYDLLRIAGETPDELLAEIATITEAINDAPTDDLDYRDEVYTPERIRAFDIAQAAYGRRVYRVAARHRGSGELAGHTVLVVESERPGWGWQFDTSVVRAHRGHRLGLLLKADMLRWLADAEPQLRIVDTWNAATNLHMIEINEILGYRIIAVSVAWQRTN